MSHQMEAPAEAWQLADGGRLQLWESWVAPARTAALFAALRRQLPWAHKAVRIAGKSIRQPRLTAWIGDPGAVYTFSGLVNEPSPWTPELTGLRERRARDTGCAFNSVLANLYRDERDSIGWHADQERELGRDPVIASVSLGATRRFQLRHRTRKSLRLELALDDGSLLLMGGTLQHFWQHAVPKEREPVGERINLTFRRVVLQIRQRGGPNRGRRTSGGNAG
jgi:alkylated DNA repair dioxygenase AlkB